MQHALGGGRQCLRLLGQQLRLLSQQLLLRRLQQCGNLVLVSELQQFLFDLHHSLLFDENKCTGLEGARLAWREYIVIPRPREVVGLRAELRVPNGGQDGRSDESNGGSTIRQASSPRLTKAR